VEVSRNQQFTLIEIALESFPPLPLNNAEVGDSRQPTFSRGEGEGGYVKILSLWKYESVSNVLARIVACNGGPRGEI